MLPQKQKPRWLYQKSTEPIDVQFYFAVEGNDKKH